MSQAAISMSNDTTCWIVSGLPVCLDCLFASGYYRTPSTSGSERGDLYSVHDMITKNTKISPS